MSEGIANENNIVLTQRSKHIKMLTKWAIFTAVLFVLFILQSTPNMFELFEVKPILILPFAISVSFFQEDLSSGIFGMFAGFLLDITTGKLIGFNAIMLLIICIGIALFIDVYVKSSFLNYFIILAATMFFVFMSDFFFSYIIAQHEGSLEMFLRRFFPSYLYTVLIAPFMYWAVRTISSATKIKKMGSE